MLVLGKNYETQFSPGMMIVGKIEGEKITILSSDEIVENYPNNGKVFIPPATRNVTIGKFMIYNLEPSHNYEQNNVNSSFYSVTNYRTVHPLIEVIDLKESYKSEKKQILESIQNGIFNLVEPLADIMLRTSDDYLIGPFKCLYDSQTKYVKITNNFEHNKYFLDIYDNSKQNIGISFYYDPFDRIERAFTIQHPDEDNIIDNLDIAPDEYIVMEALNLLRGNEKFGDFTRRARREINDWLQNITFSEEKNIIRIEKAIELINQVTPLDKEYNTYLEEIETLNLYQKKLKKSIDEQFALEYEKFEKDNSVLFKENEKLQRYNKETSSKLKEKRGKLQEITKAIEEYSNFMEERKNKMEQEFLEYYVQNLTRYNFKAEPQAYKSTQSKLIRNDSFELFENIEDVRMIFKSNLKLKDERDAGNQIFDYILLALKFNQPLFIVGNGSFTLADIILKTFTSSSKERIIPDSNLQINKLQEVIEKNIKNLGFTHVPDIQASVVSLNLLGFVKEYELNQSSNKIIFTFNSLEESKYILEELTNYLILDISSKAFFGSPFKKASNYTLGQVEHNLINHINFSTINYEESVDQIEELEFLEELEDDWKNILKKITYVNQFLNAPEKAMNYFPLIKHELLCDKNEL